MSSSAISSTMCPRLRIATRTSVRKYSMRRGSTEAGKPGDDDQKTRSQDSTSPIYAERPILGNRVTDCAGCRNVGVAPILTSGMLWIFERKGSQMRCEIRREGAGGGRGVIVDKLPAARRT